MWFTKRSQSWCVNPLRVLDSLNNIQCMVVDAQLIKLFNLGDVSFPYIKIFEADEM